MRARAPKPSVAGVGQRGVPITRKAGERGVGRLEHDKIRQSRCDVDALRVAGHDGRPVLAARLREGVGMRATGSRDPFPAVLDRRDAHVRDGGLRREVFRQPFGERFDVGDRILTGQGIHRVLHRISGQTRTVVAAGVHDFERALELHVEREVDELVRITLPPHLHEAHA